MSIIAGLLGKLFASKLALAGLGALGGLAVAPLVHPLFGKLFKSQLDKLLAPNLEDKKEAELRVNLARAAIAYAEYKMPDRGAGELKKKLATSVLAKAIPGIAGQIIADLIQEAFDSLDDEMKKSLGVNQ